MRPCFAGMIFGAITTWCQRWVRTCNGCARCFRHSRLMSCRPECAGVCVCVRACAVRAHARPCDATGASRYVHLDGRNRCRCKPQATLRSLPVRNETYLLIDDAIGVSRWQCCYQSKKEDSICFKKQGLHTQDIMVTLLHFVLVMPPPPSLLLFLFRRRITARSSQG